jgi:predicted CXXCH cytochrome family protein
MKSLRLHFVLLAAAIVVVGMTPSHAFHDGGVAECIGCHSMHSPAVGGNNLLVDVGPSATCLSCHEADAGFELGSSYHIATDDGLMPAGTAPGNLTPGGDFGWIKKDYTWTVPWGGQSEDGDTHGHNIIAPTYGYVADTRPTNVNSPGGSFPNANLECIACHDPHGKFRRDFNNVVTQGGAPVEGSGSYVGSHVPIDATETVGVYRLLGGNGYTYDGATYSGVPAAVSPDDYNRAEASGSQTRVAYGFGAADGYEGWADWCGTCHGAMHSTGNYVHDTDDTLGSEASTYNFYVKTGDMGGNATSSFLSLTPFISPSTDFQTLADLADPAAVQPEAGPTGSDLVSCLTCHRAHASGWQYALRWNGESELLTYNGVWPGDENAATPPQFSRGKTTAEVMTSYYERPATEFANYQRSLCNKCHAKD